MNQHLCAFAARVLDAQEGEYRPNPPPLQYETKFDIQGSPSAQPLSVKVSEQPLLAKGAFCTAWHVAQLEQASECGQKTETMEIERHR